MLERDRYDEYYNRLFKASNQIQLDKINKSPRTKKGGIIDKIVFYKSAFQQGMTWASFPNTLMHWIALMPLAIANVNEVFKVLGFPFAIPLDWGSMLGIGLLLGILIFGVLSYTRISLNRRQGEIGGLQSSPMYLNFCQIEEAKDLTKELINRIKILEENNEKKK